MFTLVGVVLVRVVTAAYVVPVYLLLLLFLLFFSSQVRPSRTGGACAPPLAAYGADA